MPSAAAMAAPIKPALKRSHTDFQADNDTSPPNGSSPKRPKVQFSSENNVRLLKNWDDEKTLALVKEEVKRAIERHQAGQSGLYDGLRETLSMKPTDNDAPSSALLKKYLIALVGFSNCLGRKCESLVDSLLEMQWLGRDEDFVMLYRRLLVNICASNGGYAQDILLSLVESFVSCKAPF